MIPLVFHPIYSQLDLPHKHRFPIQKYQSLYDELRAAGVGQQSFMQPDAIEPELLSHYFCQDYLSALLQGNLAPKAMKRIGFPWSAQLIRRTLTAVAGTVLTCEQALDKGKALNLTGGYHHAFADYGSGFCLINDLYLGALTMLRHPGIDRVLIFDCDVHQGDGTAKLAEANPNIYTVSLHAEKNFPYHKQSSDLDFALVRGTKDELYLETLEQALSLAIRCARPDAVIYDAGVDIHKDDDLGHLEISTLGVYQRDKLVFDTCAQYGLPLAAVIGGGYQRDIQALTGVHLQLFKAAGLV